MSNPHHRPYHQGGNHRNERGGYRNYNDRGRDNYQQHHSYNQGGGFNNAPSQQQLNPLMMAKKPKVIHVDPSVVQKTKPTINTTVQEIIHRRQLKFPMAPVNIPMSKAPPEAGEYPNPFDFPNVLIDTRTTIVMEDLSADTENDYIKKLLESCGQYTSWKRLKDPKTNRWLTFGFCEYQSCSSAIRALRLLNSLTIEPGVTIKMKCSKKVQTFMDQYQQKKLELWAKKLQERDKSSSQGSSTTDELTPEQRQLLAQLEQQMASSKSEEKIEVRESDRNEFDNYEKALDDISKIIINDLVKERMSIETENRSRESISQQLAVTNTVQKIAETGVSNEEAEQKKNLIYEEIRRFRDNEKMKEEEVKELERKRREKIYREKRLKQSKQLERERRRRQRWEKENEQDKRQREVTIREIERFERRRERRYGGIDGTGEGYVSSDEEISTGVDKKKIQIELQEKAPREPSSEVVTYEEEDQDWGRKKKKLSAVEEIEKSKRDAEYLDRDNIRKILPTSQADIFNYPMDWNVVDKYSLWLPLAPFVDEQIISLTGDPEESLSQFVLGKVETHSSPQEIINDLVEIFDEQTEPFVHELWDRLLVEMIRKQREIELENQDNIE
ncbi:hypothetical protein C9374_013972 [Naegleria lovaniensis]|uniref:Uncharacterized protein n=1 Tax=Naegleria lovaniensis TaxID=51637 RepID=A0AA88KUT5_NAELO|nr:uncharacterized protein C9374_013972 [Naegleria lovaniensis]KAG2389412.1 hypothetical protein C9374_013972 [Naegleria lovaniensis]